MAHLRDFFDLAKKCWDSILDNDPQNTRALLGKGRYMTMMAYRGGENPTEGMGLLEQVKELNSDTKLSAEADFYLGMGHRRLGDEDKAKIQFQKSISLDPTFIPARLALNA